MIIKTTFLDIKFHSTKSLHQMVFKHFLKRKNSKILITSINKHRYIIVQFAHGKLFRFSFSDAMLFDVVL